MASRIYQGIRRKQVSWTPLTQGNLLAWWDFSDTSTLFTDSGLGTPSTNGGVIGAITDKSGNSRTASQSVVSQKPLRTDNSQNSKTGGLFASASAQILLTSAFSVPQPCTIAVWSVNVASGDNPYLVDGGSGNTRVVCYGSDTSTFIYGGGPGIIGPGVTSTTAAMLMGFFNGASSISRYNGSETSGDVGTAAETLGICIGGYPTGIQTVGGTLLEIAVWGNDIGATNRLKAQQYGITKYAMP